MTESQLQDLLQSAAQFHQAGQFAKAEPIYRKILAEHPGNAETLHRLGYLRFQQGQNDEALELIEQAIGLSGQSPEYHCNHGVVLGATGRWPAAIAAYEKSVGLKPDFAQAFFNLGCAWQAQGDWARAAEAYQKAIAIWPKYFEARVNLGGVLQRLGKFDQAIATLEQACAIRADLPEAHFNLGNALKAGGTPQRAIGSYVKAIELRPDFPEAHNNLGVALRDAGWPVEAIEQFKRAATLYPDDPDPIYNAAVTLHGQWYLAPAIAAYRRLLEMRPNVAEYHHNLAVALFENGQTEEALPMYRRAISLRPDDAEMHWSYACALLATGNFSDGLEEFEWRIAVKSRGLDRGFRQPQWDGSFVQGKTILLHAEGGHGDAIQYVRYVSLVAGRGAKLLLECQPALLPLLKQIPGIDRFIARGQPLPDFDLHIPLIGLPRIFKTSLQTIPANVPYLHAGQDRIDKFRTRLPTDGLLKVGLVWSGSPFRSDVRTNTLGVFAPLAKMQNIYFISLQTGPHASEKPPENMKLIDFSAEIGDFADTAGLLSHLDLLISVDTSIAHLAGAMGKPVWTLIPCRSDPRWLLDRRDSPWYPTMRLFRQKNLRDWAEPIAQMAAELETFSHSARER